MIPSILLNNGGDLTIDSGYLPSPPLKPVKSIMKSRYARSPGLVRKRSLFHMQQLTTPLKNLQRLSSPSNLKPQVNTQKATSFFILLKDEKSQPLLKIQRKPSLIPTLQSSDKMWCATSMQSFKNSNIKSQIKNKNSSTNQRHGIHHFKPTWTKDFQQPKIVFPFTVDWCQRFSFTVLIG